MLQMHFLLTIFTGYSEIFTGYSEIVAQATLKIYRLHQQIIEHLFKLNG
jgi:hypothetical protein